MVVTEGVSNSRTKSPGTVPVFCHVARGPAGSVVASSSTSTLASEMQGQKKAGRSNDRLRLKKYKTMGWGKAFGCFVDDSARGEFPMNRRAPSAHAKYGIFCLP